MAVAYEQVHAIRSLSINPSTWTDIVGASILPISCNRVIVYNNSAVPVILASDPNNANSQVTINPGQQFEIGAGGGPGTPSFLFQAGSKTPAGSLLSTSGTVSVTIESMI